MAATLKMQPHIYFHPGINREHHIKFKIVLAQKIIAQHMD